MVELFRFPRLMLLKRTESPSLYHRFLAVFMRILTKNIKKFLVLPLSFPL